MADNDGQWERGLIEKLATAALKEQRRARRWGIFFKLLTFAYLTVIIVMAVDWRDAGDFKGGKHTALVEVNGVIAPGSDASADKVALALQAAFKDKNTQGVVLRINSPGGSPVQAQSIYDEMRRLRVKYPDIPLYVVVEDMCASGGYYVAAAADKIYVAKASIVGSIGVLMDGFGFIGLMEKLGVERRLITAGENKALLDPFQPLQEAHKQIVVELIDEIHQQFIAVVREGRGKRLKETPDMFTGPDLERREERRTRPRRRPRRPRLRGARGDQGRGHRRLHAEGEHRREVRAPLRRRARWTRWLEFASRNAFTIR